VVVSLIAAAGIHPESSRAVATAQSANAPGSWRGQLQRPSQRMARSASYAPTKMMTRRYIHMPRPIANLILGVADTCHHQSQAILQAPLCL
jgi:hypothetical protein